MTVWQPVISASTETAEWHLCMQIGMRWCWKRGKMMEQHSGMQAMPNSPPFHLWFGVGREERPGMGFSLVRPTCARHQDVRQDQKRRAPGWGEGCESKMRLSHLVIWTIHFQREFIFPFSLDPWVEPYLNMLAWSSTIHCLYELLYSSTDYEHLFSSVILWLDHKLLEDGDYIFLSLHSPVKLC